MELFRKRLDKKFLEVSKNKIYKYLQDAGLKNVEFFKSNMDAVDGLYVENLKEQGGHKMASRGALNGKPPEIAIDKSFVIFDENNEPIQLDTNIQKYIESQLGHELIHAAARYEGFTGILINIENRALNEGITQMLTEKIFGYTISPNTDGYRDNKRIAKILDATFGEEVILNTYFNHKDELKRKCNMLANDETFYSSLNLDLYMLYSIKFNRLKKDSYYANCTIDIYNKTNDLILQKVCANIIIPKLKKLSSDGQTAYIANILESAKDDENIRERIAHIITKLGKMNPEQLEKAKSQIELQLSECYELKNLTDQIYKNVDCKELVNINDDGEITLISNPNIKIKSEKLKEKILAQAYFQENHYSKIDEKRFENKIFKFLNEEKDNTTMPNDMQTSKLDRMKIFSAVKVCARNRKYIIRNELSECEAGEEIALDVMGKNGQNGLKLKELKDIYERYQIEYKDNEDEGSQMIIKDTLLGIELQDMYISKVVRFAYLWMSVINANIEKTDENEEIGYENEKLFDEISALIKNSMTETGTIETEAIYNQILQNNNQHDRRIVYTLFGNTSNLKIIYDFYKIQTQSARTEIEFPKTSPEFAIGINRAVFRRLQAQQIVNEISTKDINEKCVNEDIRSSELMKMYMKMQSYMQGAEIGINPIQ